MRLFHCLASTLPHSFRVSASLLSEILPTNLSKCAKILRSVSVAHPAQMCPVTPLVSEEKVWHGHLALEPMTSNLRFPERGTCFHLFQNVSVFVGLYHHCIQKRPEKNILLNRTFQVLLWTTAEVKRTRAFLPTRQLVNKLACASPRSAPPAAWRWHSQLCPFLRWSRIPAA